MKIFLVCVLLSVCGGGVSAQPLAEPIYTRPDGVYGLFPEWLTWTANDRLAFYSENVDLSVRGTYFVYDLETGLSQEDDPFTIELTAEQLEHYHAAEETAYIKPDTNNFIYVSEFEVYQPGEGGGFVKLFALGNFDYEAYMPIRVGYTQSIPTVLWAEGDRAVLLGVNSPLTNTTQFYHIQKQDKCSVPYCKFTETYMGGVSGSNTIFDLSADGKRVLYPNGYSNRLSLWDVEQDGDMAARDSEFTIIVEDRTIGAAFVPDNDDQILMVTEQGILLHTLSNGESEIINTDINATWASWVTFSPDNQWAAILEGDKVGREKLHVLPVEVTS